MQKYKPSNHYLVSIFMLGIGVALLFSAAVYVAFQYEPLQAQAVAQHSTNE